MFWNTIVVLLSTGGLIINQSTTKKLKLAMRLVIVNLLSTAWLNDNRATTIKLKKEDDDFVVESLLKNIVIDNQTTMNMHPLITRSQLRKN